MEKVDLDTLSANPNAIHLLAHLNTEKMRENCKAFAKELKQYVFDTERFARIYKLYVLNTKEDDCTSYNQEFDTYNRQNQLFSNTYSSLETSAKYLQQLQQKYKKEEREFYKQLSKLEEEITRFAIELRIHQSVYNSQNVTVRTNRNKLG
jgi:ribosome-binding ATPase YchF (GTP1/OBG family)